MNNKKKIFLVFDSSLLLAKRTSKFLNKKNTLSFSYENPIKLIFSFIQKLFKMRNHKIYIIVCGFRLPDLMILRIANIFKINSIYIQHGIFLSHLNRSGYINNSKFIPYLLYLFVLSFLFISPIKVFNLYKKGLRGDFPYPTFSLIYNNYWAEFHQNLLGWNYTDHLSMGIFDLSRNRINSNGEIV